MKFITNKLWRESILLGFVIIALAFFYNGVRAGAFTLSQFNISLAFAGVVMIILSHILSGTVYFWSLGKSKLGYRKMLGVVGFFIIITHATIASWLFVGSPLWINYVQSNPKTGIPGILAIFLMIFMVIISNWGMPKRIGAKRWRQMLRVGYIVIILAVIHFFQLSSGKWFYWLDTFDPILPPLSLLAFLFALFTVFLRIALWIVLRNKKTHNPQPVSKPLQPLSDSKSAVAQPTQQPVQRPAQQSRQSVQ